ncbi:DUF3040 domain-containing protein [Propionibacteriaceae bacterium Y1923]|uniref:DUF3040 domain-containing protein n=1 Tax=Aestuariimicrobium sp. Y1814 TaxID=3418742 RepID=UPI003C2333F1
MALSEEEQRRLEQLEALLTEDDPKLANTLRGTSRPVTVDGKRLAISIVGFVLGIALLVVGMQWGWFISVIGFVAMFASAAWFVLGRGGDDAPDREPTGPTSYSPTGSRRSGGDSSSAFMDKLEERWKRRQDEGR